MFVSDSASDCISWTAAEENDIPFILDVLIGLKTVSQNFHIFVLHGLPH